MLDIIEHPSSGRTLEFDPATNATRVVIVVYIHSLHATTLGVLDRREAGL